MKKVLIINAHHYFPFAEGKLNAALAENIKDQLIAKGYEVKETKTSEDNNAQEEIDKHMWADAVILQTPVYWMGMPWSFKKYMDEIYTAGISGDFCDGDGRSADRPKEGYGSGGLLQDKKYMLSITFNAPEEAFNNPEEPFFAGKSVDDLFLPQHLCYRFFGMQTLPSFVCYDVMKNPQIASDMERLQDHINQYF